MKTTGVIIVLAISVMGCNGQHRTNKEFISEKITKTASFVIDENIDKVFPLFGVFEERKWAPHWEPILIYPDKEIVEEGTTFKTKTHAHGSESEYLWIITKYEPKEYLIQYLVSTPNRFWTITVKSTIADNNNKTKTSVTYSYTGLNAEGNEVNKQGLKDIYKNNLQDWANAINNYLQNIEEH